MVQRNDADLVAAALAGGPEAFNPIVERYRGEVFSVALVRLGDFDEAEDVAQHVFIEAFARLHTLRDPNRLAPWLRSATIHRSIDALRQRRDDLDLDETESQLTSGITPDVELERNLLRQQVLNAIGRLSKAQRETTTLFYLGGYALQEIAAMQEIPVGTVKRRLHDARTRLKMEMLKMVEDTFKTEAPGEDFSDQVFHVLTRYHRDPRAWPRNWAEQNAFEARWEAEVGVHLWKNAAEGLEGFARAMQHPQALTRRYALSIVAGAYWEPSSSVPLKEHSLQLIKKALKDSNKKVRTRAVVLLLTGLLQKSGEGKMVHNLCDLPFSIRCLLNGPGQRLAQDLFG
ncbi:MAG: sigma-70 family RNA polymerase sigma factor, partial [Candidatus Latescibacteria bacterium]|nr:sigma-70 family RNA polymerase sigma factor [Candidatus Latescibacterota bacterium]